MSTRPRKAMRHRRWAAKLRVAEQARRHGRNHDLEGAWELRVRAGEQDRRADELDEAAADERETLVLEDELDRLADWRRLFAGLRVGFELDGTDVVISGEDLDRALRRLDPDVYCPTRPRGDG